MLGVYNINKVYHVNIIKTLFVYMLYALYKVAHTPVGYHVFTSFFELTPRSLSLDLDC